ncbi:trypsin-like peptidase domain-containing protein [Roseomonas sp. ACRSG]|nr:trypsin-like peptidase domain-containing protein [Roseomonas sp. ACRSG]
MIPRSELPGLGAGATRQRVDETAAPWQSLGRVQTELGQRCTGTLIAPDRVLTAAHCLTAPRREQLVQPGSVHFLLGYAAGQFRAHRRVVAFQVSAGYRPADRGPAGTDWAILQLAAPLDAPFLPLRPARPGDQIMLGGYQQDRAEVLMADPNCRVLSLQQEAGAAVLRHGCAGTRGASGAPLLRREAHGDWSIIGVAVAAARQQAGGFAVPAQAVRP